MATLKYENRKVSFASVTKKEGHKNGKHLLGIYVDKKFKKDFIAEFNKIWEDNKSQKAKKPAYDVEDWFSKDEDTKELIFWTTARAKPEDERGDIIFKQGKGCSFTHKDFTKIGTGSIIDLSVDLYFFNSSDYGEMVSRSIRAISLKELVPYEADGGLEGDAVDMSSVNDDDADESSEGEVPKDKKKKKEKKDKKKKKDKN